MNKPKSPWAGQKISAPVKAPQGADMAQFHKMASTGALSDLMFKIGGGKRK
jgi:hypothetical protein